MFMGIPLTTTTIKLYNSIYMIFFKNNHVREFLGGPSG